MPETYSMMAILTLFYIVFLSQIFVLSIHYPRKICNRIRYVLEQFPAPEYPKLYPFPHDPLIKEKAKRKITLYLTINFSIAFIGLLVLFKMITSGYRPAFEGGDEVFVLLYFFLQVIPILYAEIREYQYHNLLRTNYINKTRTAELSPRRLFDFISPLSVGIAVTLYIVWLMTYIFSRDFSVQPNIEIYATLFGMTCMQIMFASIVAKHLYGKKTNPYLSHQDQLKQISAIAKVMIFASIGASVFLTITQLVDQYSLEIIDPLISSVYFQLCTVFGVGFAFKTLRIETIDFECFKEDSSSLAK